MTTGEHAKGAPDAALVLEEFGDFECAYCRRAFPILGKLLAGKEASIRLVYRHFPVHPYTQIAAEAAEAAGVQGKFWEFHDLLFGRTGELDGRVLAGFARRLGLDMSRFHRDLELHVHRARVLQDVEAGRIRGVRGTPAFYLDGKFVDTSYGLHHLRDALREGVLQVKGGAEK
ncbi:DsbA family protein [Ramlibacter sp. AN1133]|uniref:DsbA family protein n=1 Tax=Ramlibacter sp. AN1133 TaxID=3133429 RepID=UPI0030BFEA08